MQVFKNEANILAARKISLLKVHIAHHENYTMDDSNNTSLKTLNDELTPSFDRQLATQLSLLHKFDFKKVECFLY